MLDHFWLYFVIVLLYLESQKASRKIDEAKLNQAKHAKQNELANQPAKQIKPAKLIKQPNPTEQAKQIK